MTPDEINGAFRLAYRETTATLGLNPYSKRSSFFVGDAEVRVYGPRGAHNHKAVYDFLVYWQAKQVAPATCGCFDCGKHWKEGATFEEGFPTTCEAM